MQNANSPWIIFFDDDNEPTPDYLIGLLSVILKYPHVGIWGPGEVTVDFIDKTTTWIEKNGGYTFQEKKQLKLNMHYRIHGINATRRVPACVLEKTFLLNMVSYTI